MNKPKWICRNCGQTSDSDVIDVQSEGICDQHPTGVGNHAWKRNITKPSARFRATWEIPVSLDEFELYQFHISCGVDNKQENGYFPSDKDARLTIDTGESTFFVTLTVPTRGLEKEEGYWTSANQAFGKYDGEVELVK